MKVQTLIIEYADIAIEEVITYHKSDDKRYRKLKGNKTFWQDLDKVMARIRAATNNRILNTTQAYTTRSSSMIKAD